MSFKRLSSILFFICSYFSTQAQYHATVSGNSPYKVNHEASFSSYANDWNNFLLFKRTENKEHIYSLVMTDNDDRIVLTSDLRVATVVEDNHFLLAGVALAGRNLTAFVESRNAKTGRNVLAMQAVDNKGGLTSEGMLVGYFDSKEPDNAGAWHITSTPDQEHIALIAQLPREQGKAERFMYYFINENLTITHKGEFAINIATIDEITVDQFLASDDGDFYIVSNTKNAAFPTVYQTSVRSAGVKTIPLEVSDTTLSVAGWLAAVAPRGGLYVAGYLKDRGLPLAANITGTWNFSTDHPENTTLHMFDKVLEPSKMTNILFNGDTYFAIGEGQRNFQVTGFDTSGRKKFELRMPHSATGLPAQGVAAGIVQNGLCLIYNDAAGRQDHTGTMQKKAEAGDGLHLSGTKTFTLSISNDGKYDPPLAHEQELGIGKLLSTSYFSSAADRIVTLMESPNGIKAVTFR